MKAKKRTLRKRDVAKRDPGRVWRGASARLNDQMEDQISRLEALLRRIREEGT